MYRKTTYLRFIFNALAWAGLLLPLLAPVTGEEALNGAIAGEAGWRQLVIAENGWTEAVVVVSPEAGAKVTTGEGNQARTTVLRKWERQAADDLVHYIELMSGARPAVADTPEKIAAALAGKAPVLLVGEAALETKPGLRRELERAAKQDYVLRPDAIVVRREGNRVYLAGMDPREEHPGRRVLKGEGHYFAVAHLLRLWGCRWYLPTEFGEVVPEHKRLAVGKLNHVYAPPFEVRAAAYGYSWLGDMTGTHEFSYRNMMNGVHVSCGHTLGGYVKELAPEGGSIFNVPISEEATIEHVALKAEKDFADGKDISLGMNDGAYHSDSKLDAELAGNLRDKYFQGQALADNFMTLYNGVCRNLLKKHPESSSIIGFFAYVNMTIPPQRLVVAEKPLVALVAPIDIDPNHGMDDPRSPPRQEYREIMHRWAKVMEGRAIVYDYDQGMLVWRDLPNPSHQSFRHDVKHYRDAGILGFNTESRGAYATVFLNLYLRGQLMWNPDADVDALLDEFYPKFYGPAAEPMRRYWSTLYKAWEDTIVTEHEFYTIPAIYTESLVDALRGHLANGIKAVAPLRKRAADKLSRNERLYLERMEFTQNSFGVIDHYTSMVQAAATRGDYAAAVQAGERALAARQALIDLGTKRSEAKRGSIGMLVSAGMGENGAAWFPGEVQQYRDLLALTDGTKGKLIERLPLEWAFRRDPNDTGLAQGFGYRAADLAYWNANKNRFATPTARKDYPINEWEMLRSDLYAQAQGVLHPDWQSFTGFMWYKTSVELNAAQTGGKVHLHFPGLFSEAWLYVNGNLIAHRPQNHMWWYNDYRFDWDVDVSGHLKPGKNDITLRVHNTHHNGGLFRRPFLYAPAGQ
ncbi:MAG: DUF4838 domain-containing protein [Planctomycetota bacterium]|nr:DUF4838 domain-containing protein [Planctomycetota bacterium]